MADYTKITSEDLVGHRIEELADTPAMTTAALKKRFDSLSVDVIIPKFNQLVDEISNLDGNVENEFVATREYVNEKDTEKLQESKDYTDEQIGIATTEIKGYSDTEDARVLTEATAYSDDKDADTLASAKSYADTKDVDTLDTAKAYADSEDTVMLNSAKAYADTVGERKLAEANMYTDASSRDTYFQAKDYTDKNTIKSVVVTPELSTGNKVGTIAVNGSVTTLYAPTTSADIPTASQIPYSNSTSQIPETKVQGALDSAFRMLGSLPNVAKTGNYNDLSNKPTNATTSKAGFVKPDGETITIDADGTIHGVDGDGNFAWGGINIVQPTSINERVINGVTRIYNGDGTYTFNGTASADAWFPITTLNLPNGRYKVVGSTAKDRTTYYTFINAYKSDGTFNTIATDGVPIFDADSSLYTKYDLGFGVKKGVTVTDLIVKPMLTTDLSRTYDTFVPYGKTNVELTKEIEEKASTEELSQATTNIMGSDAYNPSTSYNVGDCCIYDNALYKNIVACSNTLPTDSTYWEKVTLAQINNDLSDKSRAFELVHATYKNASALSVNAGNNVSATLKLDSGSTGDIFLGIEQMVSGNYNCAFSSITSNGQNVAIANASSSTKSLSAGSVIVVARWLKWL